MLFYLEVAMFGFLKKKEVVREVSLYAIGKGRTLPIENVPDQTFASGLLGEGIGFVFEGDMIYAPCNGKVMMVAKTNHAIGLKLDNDAEILIHIGMDTVNLNGEGLYPQVSCDDTVKQGAPLLKVDRQFMEEKGIDLTTPIVLTNGQDYILAKEKGNDTVDQDDCIIRIIKR